ncbi:MAG: hypothetical protein V2A70_04260 [Candidatus Omnitrophota bacterium]
MAKLSKQAQSIIELAVFGAVLFFIIAGIASVYLGGSLQQNSLLKTSRTALYNSFQTSRYGYASRSTSIYYVLEDRLGSSVGKFGASEREPLMMASSGSMTKNMLLPIDFAEKKHLPVIDVVVNGQTFSFATRLFKMYKFFFDAATYDVTTYRYTGTIPTVKTGTDSTWTGYCPGSPDFVEEHPSSASRMSREWKAGYDIGGIFPWLYHEITANDPKFSTTWSTANMERFNYKRSGNPEDMYPYAKWANYATWQWEPVAMSTVHDGINTAKGSYPGYDANADLRPETLYELVEFQVGSSGACNFWAAYAIAYTTSTGAEWDLEKSNSEYTNYAEDFQGFHKDAGINTQMQDANGAAYLNIKEGAQYSSDGKPVQVSTLKKNQYDIVERVLQLNKDMDSSTAMLARNPNIEVSCAGCCSGGSNAQYTCFDTASKRLYIRSRISDKRGRKWVTSTDEDFSETVGAK